MSSAGNHDRHFETQEVSQIPLLSFGQLRASRPIELKETVRRHAKFPSAVQWW
jgi:hypothetical protein